MRPADFAMTTTILLNCLANPLAGRRAGTGVGPLFLHQRPARTSDGTSLTRANRDAGSSQVGGPARGRGPADRSRTRLLAWTWRSPVSRTNLYIPLLDSACQRHGFTGD